MAELLLGNNPGQTFSPVIANASFNPSYLNYTGGMLEQLDQRPTNATFFASWTSMLNANWSGLGNGSLAVSPFNGAAINNGVLDLTGSTNKYVTFSAIGNADSAQTGTIEFEYTPNYSGTPATIQAIFSVGETLGSYVNALEILHYVDGHLYLNLWDISSSPVVAVQGSWNPTQGTTYTIRCEYDGITGVNAIYIDDILFEMTTQTFSTRTNSIVYGFTGQVISGTSGNANFTMKNLSIYSTIVTPSSPVLPATIYMATSAMMPLFTYSGVASLQAFTAFATTDSGGTQYTMNGLYWNGSGWVSSNGTYAQSNTASMINTNIATLPASNTLQIDAIYNAGSTQQSVGLITTTYTGQLYPTTAPGIAPNAPLTMDQLFTFTDVNSQPGSDTVTYVLRIGTTTKYWFNGAAWVVSNGTVSQSNPASVVQANVSTLPISTGQFVTPIALLYTPDGLTTPSLTSLTLNYDYFGERPTGPNVCTVYGYIVDETDTPVSGATVSITNPTTLLNQGIVIAQGILTAVTNSMGYFHITLCETATIEASLLFSVQYPVTVSDNLGTPPNNFTFGYAQIPDMPEANFATFTFTPTP